MGERLNIKNLIIEPERRPKLPFDLEEDVTPEQWQIIAEKREKSISAGNLQTTGDYIFLESLRLGKPPALSTEIASKLDRELQIPHMYWRDLNNLVLLKSLYTGKSPFPEDDYTWQDMETLRAEELGSSQEGLSDYVDLALLTTVQLGEPPQLSPQQYNELQDFCRRFSEKGDWQDWYQYARYASILALASAKKILLKLSGGLTVAWDEKDKGEPETPPQPLTRKF